MQVDRRIDQVSNLTDFDYALIVKGTDVAKVTKQQLAELVGNLLYGATTKETLASVVAGIIGVLRLNKTLAAGESMSISKGYGMLIISSSSSGLTSVFSVANGTCTIINGSADAMKIEITRASEYSVSIKNVHTAERNYTFTFFG